MKGRKAHALLTWVPEVALEAVHRGGVIEPLDVIAFKLLGRAARQKPLSMAALASDADVLEPDEAVADRVQELTGKPVFVDCYAGYGARVVKIPLSGLVAPQWCADMDYIDDLMQTLPSRDDEGALFDYSFAEDELGDVAVLSAGVQQVGIINVHRGQPPRAGPMSAELTADRRRVTFSVDVEARPHLIHVMAAQLAIQQGPVQFVSKRLIVLDGVHRLVAMLASGYTHAYALLLTDLPPQQLANYMGGGGPHLLLDAALGAPRPPRLDDYLDDRVFEVVSLEALDGSFCLVVSPQFQKRPYDTATTSRTAAIEVPVRGTKTETVRKRRAHKQSG